jgi:hypothetical protein
LPVRRARTFANVPGSRERGGGRTIVRERGGNGISLDDVRAVVREELKATDGRDGRSDAAEQPPPDPQVTVRSTILPLGSEFGDRRRPAWHIEVSGPSTRRAAS